MRVFIHWSARRVLLHCYTCTLLILCVQRRYVILDGSSLLRRACAERVILNYVSRPLFCYLLRQMMRIIGVLHCPNYSLCTNFRPIPNLIIVINLPIYEIKYVKFPEIISRGKKWRKTEKKWKKWGKNKHLSNKKVNTIFLPTYYLLTLFPNLSKSWIWGSHGGEYEDCCLLGCSTV
jgi:hypothetical protein